MSVKNYLSLKYQDLCMRLGDAQMHFWKAQSLVESLKAEIEALNNLTPDLKKVCEAQEELSKAKESAKNESIK